MTVYIHYLYHYHFTLNALPKIVRVWSTHVEKLGGYSKWFFVWRTISPRIYFFSVGNQLLNYVYVGVHFKTHFNLRETCVRMRVEKRNENLAF